MLLGLFCALIFSHANQQAPTQKSSPLQVPWQTELQLWVSGNKPAYPQIATLAQVEGVVRVRATVATDGSTKDLVYLSGPPILMKSAMDAVRTWHFRPTIVNGVPVEVEVTMMVDFFLVGHDANTLVSESRRNVEKKPNDAKAHADFAFELLTVGQADESVAEFRKALALRPNDTSCDFGLGNALEVEGNLTAAIAAYRQGLSIKPGDTDHRTELASLLEDAGDLDGAIAEYKTAIEQEPRQPTLHYELGLALSKKGDSNAAIREFRHAIHEGFGTAETHYQLGIALEKQGNLHDALKEYKDAVSHAPNEQRYRDARDRLAQSSHQ